MTKEPEGKKGGHLLFRIDAEQLAALRKIGLKTSGWKPQELLRQAADAIIRYADANGGVVPKEMDIRQRIRIDARLSAPSQALEETMQNWVSGIVADKIREAEQQRTKQK